MLGHDRSRLVHPLHAEQPTRRLRCSDPKDEDEQRGHGRAAEHPAPGVRAEVGEQVAHEIAHRESHPQDEHQTGQQGAAHSPRQQFGAQGRRDRTVGTERDSHQESDGKQLPRVGREELQNSTQHKDREVQRIMVPSR